MIRRGIWCGAVASEIGALGRGKMEVYYDKLVIGLCHRFEATKDEAIDGIDLSLKYGVIRINNGIVKVRDTGFENYNEQLFNNAYILFCAGIINKKGEVKIDDYYISFPEKSFRLISSITYYNDNNKSSEITYKDGKLINKIYYGKRGNILKRINNNE